MKKPLLLLVFALMALSSFAQVNLPVYEKASRDLMRFYNEARYDSLFLSFSPRMKEGLPLEKTKEVLTGLRQQMGKMSGLEYQWRESEAVFYKGEFANGLLLVLLSLDDNDAIAGLYFLPYETPPAESAAQRRNTTPMAPPFRGEWTVVWGGDTKMQNYHIGVPMQKNAIDIIMVGSDDKPFRTDGKSNDDYYCFGQKVFSPCDGEIYMAVDGVRDNTPGVMNEILALGNSVVIETEAGEYVVLAHFKNGSVKVKQGEAVKQGDLLGLCGNSGNSTSAHIHMHIQDGPDFNKAVGIKCFFESVSVNGVPQSEHSPLRGERIAPLN